MGRIAVCVVVFGLVLGTLTASAEIPPPTPTPTPSFDLSGTITTGPGWIPLKGCPISGSSNEFTGPDGTVYISANQVNIVPCPSATPAPTPTPTAAPTPTPAPVVTKVDDAAFTYFGAAAGIAPATTTAWTVFPSDAVFIKYGPGDHASSTINAAYGLIFTGTEIRLFAAIAPHHGIAAVSLDGAAPVDVDFYSAIRIDQAPVYYSGALAAGIHRIIVKVTGRKNAASTDIAITADRADITGGTIILPLSK